MPDIYDAFMEGRELRFNDELQSYPIDFLVWNEERTLAALAGWWRSAWGQNLGFITVGAAFDPETGTFPGLDSVVLATATDAETQATLDQARDHTDFARQSYLAQLMSLVEFEPDFDFQPWLDAVFARPTRNAREELLQATTALRSVGKVQLLNEDDKVVDALAIDELGYAETMQEDGWLSLFAEQWSGYPEADRPSVGEFMQWLTTQNSYGAGVLSSFEVTSHEGPLAALVQEAQLRNPTS